MKRFEREVTVGFVMESILDALPIVRGRRRRVMLDALRVLIRTTPFRSLDPEHYSLLRKLGLKYEQ